MFGNNCFRQPSVGGVVVIHLVAVEEEDDVAVLLQGAAFSKIGEHRSLVGSLFEVAAELAEGEYGAVEFAG